MHMDAIGSVHHSAHKSRSTKCLDTKRGEILPRLSKRQAPYWFFIINDLRFLAGDTVIATTDPVDMPMAKYLGEVTTLVGLAGLGYMNVERQSSQL